MFNTKIFTLLTKSRFYNRIKPFKYSARTLLQLSHPSLSYESIKSSVTRVISYNTSRNQHRTCAQLVLSSRWYAWNNPTLNKIWKECANYRQTTAGSTTQRDAWWLQQCRWMSNLIHSAYRWPIAVVPATLYHTAHSHTQLTILLPYYDSIGHLEKSY